MKDREVEEKGVFNELSEEEHEDCSGTDDNDDCCSCSCCCDDDDDNCSLGEEEKAELKEASKE